MKMSNLWAWKLNTNVPRHWLPLEWNESINTPSAWWMTRRRMLARDWMALVSHSEKELKEVSDLERGYAGCKPTAPADKDSHCSHSCFYSTVVSKGILGGGPRMPEALSTGTNIPLLHKSSCWKIIFTCQRLGHDVLLAVKSFDRKQKTSLPYTFMKTNK